MAKAAKKNEIEERQENYEPKVSFDGTFEQMMGITVKDAEKKLQERKSEDEKKKDLAEKVDKINNSKR